MKLILQIALGVSLGIVLGGSLLFLYTGAFAEHLINAALEKRSIVVDNRLLPPTTTPPPIAPPNPMQATSALPPGITPEPTLAPQPGITPAPAEIHSADKDAAIIAEQEEQRQREIQFKASYKKPDKCQSPNQDHDLLVACGNEYIRARDKFEKSWQQEKLKK
jgi:hypothetical protein